MWKNSLRPACISVLRCHSLNEEIRQYVHLIMARSLPKAVDGCGYTFYVQKQSELYALVVLSTVCLWRFSVTPVMVWFIVICQKQLDSLLDLEYISPLIQEPSSSHLNVGNSLEFQPPPVIQHHDVTKILWGLLESGGVNKCETYDTIFDLLPDILQCHFSGLLLRCDIVPINSAVPKK